jgi:hypothetical protein
MSCSTQLWIKTDSENTLIFFRVHDVTAAIFPCQVEILVHLRRPRPVNAPVEVAPTSRRFIADVSVCIPLECMAPHRVSF